MFIDINSIKIKVPGGQYISLGNYTTDSYGKPIALITEAKYSYNKLWSSDTGRNLAGTNSGTLVGIFPKIVVQFKRLSQSELEAIVPILDAPKQIVSYYDPRKKRYDEIETYTGDYEITDKSMLNNGRKNEGFSCSFIAIRKRS